MIRLFLGLCCMLLLTACGTNVPCNVPVYGLDEFVMDSYRLRHNSLFFLQEKGCYPQPLPEGCLCERETTICETDILKIILYHPIRKDLPQTVERISEENCYQVSCGCIRLPELPPLRIVDLTLLEAAHLIEQAYQEHLQEVKAYVSFSSRPSYMVWITSPSFSTSVSLQENLRLSQLLSSCSFFNHNRLDTPLRACYLVRKGKIYRIDLERLVLYADPTQDCILQPQDHLYAGLEGFRESYIVLLGEFAVPQALSYVQPINLRTAFGMAHGNLFTGDLRYIQVVRGGSMHPKFYLINWSDTLGLPNESLLLFPGDMVYVTAKPITQWNRFIDQLLPSFGNVLFVNEAIGNFRN